MFVIVSNPVYDNRWLIDNDEHGCLSITHFQRNTQRLLSAFFYSAVNVNLI